MKRVFEKSDSIWVDVLPTITKQNNNRKPFSNKLTPMQASLKVNEGYIYENLKDKQNRRKTKFKIHNLVKIAD